MVLEASGSPWSGQLMGCSGLGKALTEWGYKGWRSDRHFLSIDLDCSHLMTAGVWVSCRPTALSAHGVVTVLRNHTD